MNFRNGFLSLVVVLSLGFATTSCAGSSESEYEECIEAGQRLYEAGVNAGMDPLKAMEQAQRQMNCDQYRR